MFPYILALHASHFISYVTSQTGRNGGYWDRCFKRKAKEQEFEIALYRRYVDDITIVAREISGGTGNDETEDGSKTTWDERGMTRL